MRQSPFMKEAALIKSKKENNLNETSVGFMNLVETKKTYFLWPYYCILIILQGVNFQADNLVRHLYRLELKVP